MAEAGREPVNPGSGIQAQPCRGRAWGIGHGGHPSPSAAPLPSVIVERKRPGKRTHSPVVRGTLPLDHLWTPGVQWGGRWGSASRQVNTGWEPWGGGASLGVGHATRWSVRNLLGCVIHQEARPMELKVPQPSPA